MQASYVRVGFGLNVENSIHIQRDHGRVGVSTRDSLKSMESPAPSINIPLDGNTTDASVLSALAAVLPLKKDSASAVEEKRKEAADLSYFEPKVLYTTIPIIVVCMVGIAVLAELFGDGFESGR